MRRIFLLLMVGYADCKRADPSTPAAPPSASATATATATASQTPRHAVSCASIDRVTVNEASIGFRATDIVDLAAAVAGDNAVITLAVDGNRGCDHDGCDEDHVAFAIDLDGSKVGKPYRLSTSAAGIAATESAAPFAVSGGLFVLTQGHRGAAATPEVGHDVPNTEYVLNDNKVAHKWPESIASRYVVASAGPVAWALAIGTTEAFGSATVRAVRFESAARSVATIPTVERFVDAPTIAASADHVIVAYRAKGGNRLTSPKLYAVWIDPATAKPLGTAQVIATGDVGAPTMAIAPGTGTAHIVWAEKKADETWQLRQASWAASGAKPSAGTDLHAPATGLAPALAWVAQGFALAWVEGDAKGTVGTIHAGFGETVDGAASAGLLRSANEVKNARDPEWASDGDHALLVWSEHDGTRRIAGAWCR